MFMVELIDDLIEQDDPIFTPGRGIKVLDPCAGGDAEHPMSYPTILAEWGKMFTVDTIDIRTDSKAKTKADYLKYKVTNVPDVIITNPPFCNALEIVQKALQDVAVNGLVIMLLRLNFLGSKGRYAFLKEHLPERIYVHSRRMSFTKTGGTDSIEYCHMVWRRGGKPDFSALKVIDFT
jgi:hypothetical protein